MFISAESDCYTYVEHGSKNHTGGLRHFSVENKQVPCPAVPEDIPKCLVFLLDLYLAKLAQFAFMKDILYLRPELVTPLSDEEPWYDNVPAEKNILGNMVKQMFVDAGIDRGREEDIVTNHILRSTGTTTMFQANVPEKIIQKTTGHRSLHVLLCYQRISGQQHHTVSRVLMFNQSYEKEPSKAVPLQLQPLQFLLLQICLGTVLLEG